MKKFLFTFLLLIAPMFNAHAIVGGTDSGQQTIPDTCTSVKDWTEGTPVDGNTWYFDNDDGCTLYRKALPTCTGTTVRPSLYMFSCGAGCHWQPNAAYNSNAITKRPGACKKCKSGTWSEKHNRSLTCDDIDTTYFHKIDKFKYCTASACEDGAEAEKITLSDKTYYRCPKGKAKTGDKSVCGCFPGLYLKGTTCENCPNKGLGAGDTKYPNDSNSSDIPFNFANSEKSCYQTINSFDGEDETGTFILSGSPTDRCYY